MSKPVPVYRDSLRLGSPASVLLATSQRLTASRDAPPVHGVSTTRVTTPDPGSQHRPAGQPGRRSGVAARYHLSDPWPMTIRSAAQIAADSVCSAEPRAHVGRRAHINQFRVRETAVRSVAGLASRLPEVRTRCTLVPRAARPRLLYGSPRARPDQFP